jgi:hypothetical protein
LRCGIFKLIFYSFGDRFLLSGPFEERQLMNSRNWAKERTDAALVLQNDLLAAYKDLRAAYDEAGRTWLTRVQSEVALWSDLAAKLATTRTLPEALEAYAKCISQRMEMAADDGRLLGDEAQQIAQKFTKTLGEGTRQWRVASRE